MKRFFRKTHQSKGRLTLRDLNNGKALSLRDCDVDMRSNTSCVSSAHLRMSGFHLTVGSGMMSFSDAMALEGNFSVILTEDWR